MTADELREPISWVEERLPALVEQVNTTVEETIPLYRGGDHVSTEELRRSVEENLRFLIAALRDPHAPRDPSVPTGTGRRRAHQGVPLPEVLQVYRIAFSALWGSLVQHAADAERLPARRSLLTASTVIWSIVDEHAILVTEAYREATAEILVTQQHRRSALVEVLLTGHTGRDAGPWEAASLLGFPPGAQLHVVAAHTRDVAVETLPGIERALGESGFASGWRLTPSLQLGVIASSTGSADDLLAVLRSRSRGRVGLSPGYQAPADTPRALRLARAALGLIPRAAVEVRRFSASPIAALLAADRTEGGRLADDVLGPVLRLAEGDRSVLLETLGGYLGSGGSADIAAEQLHCHPNTVRYRLRKIEELTGRSLGDPAALAELTTAFYAVGLDDSRHGAAGLPE